MKPLPPLVCVLIGLMPYAGVAFTPEFPLPAQLNASDVSELTNFDLITGAWSDGALPTVALQGAVTKQAWRLPTSELTSLQLLNPLRNQLSEAGYDLVFECETNDCGGFDFRFSADVFLEPKMHVNLNDFRFLSARRTSDTGASQAITVLISRTSGTGYVQINQLGASTAVVVETVPAPTTEPVISSDLDQKLETQGHVVLEGLTFQSGGAALAQSGMSDLEALAQYLKQNPTRLVTLVGHTDAVGSLAPNIALSKQRAQSVREHLINQLGVNSAQVAAEGVGYLSPRASNLTPEGREANRRVEVTLTSVE